MGPCHPHCGRLTTGQTIWLSRQGRTIRKQNRHSQLPHGSRGVTLSWGTSHLAVEEALRTPQTHYAVIGCGAVGLAAGRWLQRKGFEATIYAKDVPPNTTSNIAGAQWDAGRLPANATPEFKDQYTRALPAGFITGRSSTWTAAHPSWTPSSHLKSSGDSGGWLAV